MIDEQLADDKRIERPVLSISTNTAGTVYLSPKASRRSFCKTKERVADGEHAIKANAAQNPSSIVHRERCQTAESDGSLNPPPSESG